MGEKRLLSAALDEDIEERFYHIKEALGLHSNSETVRFLIKHYSNHLGELRELAATPKQEVAPDAAH